jgi:hypothetical protein
VPEGNQGHSHLQLDRFDFGYESASIARKERRHDAEHGVTEAAVVQDHPTKDWFGRRHRSNDVV